MSGIVSIGVYLPYNRLSRETIGAALGAPAGKGTRSVASYDEDATTMGVEAARNALAATEVSPSSVLFATSVPTYLDKTNATAIHAGTRPADRRRGVRHARLRPLRHRRAARWALEQCSVARRPVGRPHGQPRRRRRSAAAVTAPSRS